MTLRYCKANGLQGDPSTSGQTDERQAGEQTNDEQTNRQKTEQTNDKRVKMEVVDIDREQSSDGGQRKFC